LQAKGVGQGVASFGGSGFASAYSGGVSMVSATSGAQTYNANSLVAR